MTAHVALRLCVSFIIIDAAVFTLFRLGVLSFPAVNIREHIIPAHYIEVLAATLLILVEIITLSSCVRSASASVKRNTATFNDMLAKIDAAYTAQKRFVSDASHELRTPIAVIQGYANLLLRWGASDPATLDESINAIKSEADGMKLMVNQLLFLARGDNESMQVDRQAISLTEIVNEVVREARVIAEDLETGKDIPAHVIEDKVSPGVMICGDAGLIKQLTRILMDNSIKYSAPDGIIRIALTADGFGRALMSVSDEGCGIPPEILPHIFDRFVRADESRSRSAGGAGLGLSIAKWIVEQHGGRIDVISSPGIGSRFTVDLPVL